MENKFCRCLDYRTLAWIALVIQVVSIVLLFAPEEGRFLLFGAGYPIVGGYIAKIVLLAVSLLCCKNDNCPRITVAVFFFFFAIIEIIQLIFIWPFVNVVGAAAGMAGGSDDTEELVQQLIWWNSICLIYVVFIVLEITLGVGLCSWYYQGKKEKEEPTKQQSAQSE